MKALRLRTFAYAFGFVLATLGAVGAAASPALAVGAEVDRTDSSGNPGGRIVGAGNTNPSCCCAWAGNSHVAVGVKVCYLPVP